MNTPQNQNPQNSGVPGVSLNDTAGTANNLDANQKPAIAAGSRKRQTDVKTPPSGKPVPQIPTHPSNYVGAEHQSTSNNHAGRTPTMGKLTQILGGNGGNFRTMWGNTEAADEFGPLPKGQYTCHATKGDLEASRSKRTPGYSVEFTVIEGPFKGRKIWTNFWLTPAALPQSKRDLRKLGITSPEHLEQPLPRGIRCKVNVVVRCDDDGVERNKVQSFEMLGIDKPEIDPFAPKSDDSGTDSVAPPASSDS